MRLLLAVCVRLFLAGVAFSLAAGTRLSRKAVTG
jgi:hypothetical protein